MIDETYDLGVMVNRTDAIRSKYPFDQLNVGESFPVSVAECHLIRCCATYHGKKSGKKFSVKKNHLIASVDKNGIEPGYLCMRVK